MKKNQTVIAGTTKAPHSKQKKTTPPPAVDYCKEVKKIPDSGYDFDDVIKNVDALLKCHFPDWEKKIKAKVHRLGLKYADQIEGEYETFLNMVNSKRELERWWLTVTPSDRRLSRLEHHILDLYFQIEMVQDYDVYNDVLIYAYLEDIQPLLN
jgi:hypothetical protein